MPCWAPIIVRGAIAPVGLVTIASIGLAIITSIGLVVIAFEIIPVATAIGFHHTGGERKKSRGDNNKQSSFHGRLHKLMSEVRTNA